MTTLLSVSEYFSTNEFPSYSSPSPVAEYSVTKERNVVPGRAEAKYFYKKVLDNDAKCHFDLNKGFDKFESKDDLLPNERLDIFSKWLISQAPPNTPLKKVCCDADFVCYRGLLTRIASTICDNKEGWIVSAVRIGSTIFLCEFPTEEKKHRLKTMSRRDKLMCYWGFKFEQYVTADTPTSSPVTNEAVSNVKEFDVVLRTTLGSGDRVRLLFSAETDCLDSDGRYLELKTQAYGLINRFWAAKAMKWWIQSFLVGVQQIVVGFRDNNGIVESVKRINVADLYRKAMNWSPSKTFNFLLDVLKLIKAKMYEVHTLNYVLFEYDRIKEEITFSIVPSEDDDYMQYRFLSTEFLEHFNVGVGSFADEDIQQVLSSVSSYGDARNRGH